MARQISRLDKALEDKDYIHSARVHPLKEVAHQIFRLNPTISLTKLYGILRRNHSPICPAKMTVYLWLRDWRYKDTIRTLKLENERLVRSLENR